MALPLMKHDTVDAAIELLMENTPSSHRMLFDFCEYFKNQWIIRTPMKYWNLGPIHLRCNNAVEGMDILKKLHIRDFDIRLVLAYNNRLQYRFGLHPSVWSFIHFLRNEESLVMMRTEQIKSGNSRDKSLGSSIGHERARIKTKQLKNLARLYTINTIGLKQYVNSLSCFVGDFTKKKKKDMANAKTAAPDLEIPDD